jgi:hypothetical protein
MRNIFNKSNVNKEVACKSSHTWVDYEKTFQENRVVKDDEAIKDVDEDHVCLRMLSSTISLHFCNIEKTIYA